MSELVAVKIKGTVATQRYGTLVSGDILRTDAAYAKFLIEECSAGSYVEAAVIAKKPAKAPGKKIAKAAAESAPAESTEETTTEAAAQTDTPAE